MAPSQRYIAAESAVPASPMASPRPQLSASMNSLLASPTRSAATFASLRLSPLANTPPKQLQIQQRARRHGRYLAVLMAAATATALMARSFGAQVPCERDHKQGPSRGLSIVAAFNHKDDLHQRTQAHDEPFRYIASWYNSLHRFPDMHGLVFTTMHDDAFIANYTTDQVQFVRVDRGGAGFARGMNKSLNDQRFFVIEEYLNAVLKVDAKARMGDGYTSQASSSSSQLRTDGRNNFDFDYILLNDVRDVSFLRNPFRYMRMMDESVDNHHQLFVGEEVEPKFKAVRWQNSQWKKCLGVDSPYRRQLNAGIIGGHTSVLVPFLKEMNLRLDTAKGNVCDQAVMQQVVGEMYGEKIITGYPLHSRFHSMQNETETLAYIQHK